MIKSRVFHIFLVTFIICAVSGPLVAENHTYESTKPIEKIVPDLINELGKAGYNYEIKKVFNPKRDGREGMVLRFKPSGIICEFIFMQDPKNRNRSLVRVHTFDRGEMRKLHRLMLKNLGMKHNGVSSKQIDRNPWPVRPTR